MPHTLYVCEKCGKQVRWSRYPPPGTGGKCPITKGNHVWRAAQ